MFFKRAGRYYVITGSSCCACKGGSSMDVFVASAPMGPYTYLGDVGSSQSAPYDPHSPSNFVTRAQGASVFVVPVADGAQEAQFVWLGNQWVTSAMPGRPRNHDLLYFARLVFGSNGTIEQLSWQDETHVDVTLTVPQPE